MSSESYTFACPACGIHLSVPRSLAGVRGPCPQCHDEIRAPEPSDRIFPAPFADPPAAAVTAPAGAASIAEAPAQAEQEPPKQRVAEADPPRVRRRAKHRRSSRWMAVCGLLVILALAAAAGLNFLPAGTLQAWMERFRKSSPEAIPTAKPATTPETEASKVLGTGDPTPPPAIEPLPSHDLAPPSTDVATPTPAPDPSVALPVKPQPEVAPAKEGEATSSQTKEPSVREPPTSPPQVAKAIDPPVRGADPPSLLPDLRPPPETSPPETSSETDETPTSAPAEPLKALENFLRAPTWKERLAFCLNPDRVRSEMAEYYTTTKDGPQPYTSVASFPLPAAKFPVTVFHVTFADLPQGFPIPVEQTDKGWKIDWRAFLEFRDSRLKKFFAKYQDSPAIFRVLLRRAHYFDKDVPNLDQKYCFRVSAPIDGHDGYVFVDKRDSIAVPKLEGKLEWDPDRPPYHVMAKLKWVKGAGGHPYVELRDIVAHSWRDEPTPRVGQK